jgi:2-dehydro-3-deoxyphosphogluconate aldolase/(4S)-4-hydroxy-2-oxoglutarate aldolase
MTAPDDIRARIESERLVAIIRTGDLADAMRIVDLLVEVGVTVVEFSLSGAAALPALRDSAERYGSQLTLGTGTVLDPRDVEASVAAGATFLVAPNVAPAVCREADRVGVLHIPGALTPTEVALAVQLGAPIVKLFPASRLGPAYVRDLHGPFPDVRLLATGGVHADNAAEFLAAGCVAVAAGGALTGGDPEAARRLVHATRRP